MRQGHTIQYCYPNKSEFQYLTVRLDAVTAEWEQMNRLLPEDAFVPASGISVGEPTKAVVGPLAPAKQVDAACEISTSRTSLYITEG